MAKQTSLNSTLFKKKILSCRQVSASGNKEYLMIMKPYSIALILSLTVVIIEARGRFSIHTFYSSLPSLLLLIFLFLIIVRKRLIVSCKPLH